MKKLRRLGRPRAGAQDRQSAHARRLLLVLIGIARRLVRLQKDREAREAYRRILRELRQLQRDEARPATRRAKP